MATRTITKAFSGGVVDPQFFGKYDDQKFQTGVAKMENFIAVPFGPTENRPGLRFVAEAKYPNKKCRIVEFEFSTTQTFAIEMGEGYFRFHTQASTLLVGSPGAWSSSTAYVQGDLVTYLGVKYYCLQAHTNTTPPNASFWYPIPSTYYEIPNPYAEADLFEINFVQSNDVLTFVHEDYPPAELRRLGATFWVYAPIDFDPSLPQVTGLSVTGNGPNASPAVNVPEWVVTAIDGLGSESEQSTATSFSSLSAYNFNGSGAYIDLAWTAVTGATAYNIYRRFNGGIYGFIGQTTGLTFKDDGIAEDLSTTPPIIDNPFNGSDNYPSAVCYFEQRRVFAGTTNKPQQIIMTKTGTESDTSVSRPVRDDDAIKFNVAARTLNRIRHLVPTEVMWGLSNSAEWKITSVNQDSITPTSISVRAPTSVGSSYPQPVLVNNNVIFVSEKGSRLRELGAAQNGGYITGDLSIRASHLVKKSKIVDISFTSEPQQIVWGVRDDGVLLGLTYVPEQQVYGWHTHATDGSFESVGTIKDDGRDYSYFVVKRNIDGSDVRYIERMERRVFDSIEDCFFVDAGISYSGSPASTFTGLDHLEGETVAILADGAEQPQQEVVGGSVTLESAFSKVTIGLPYNSDLQTLPMYMEIPGAAQGRYKNVNQVWMRVFESAAVFAGPAFNRLTEYKQRTTESPGSPPELRTDEINIKIAPSWSNSGGQVCVRQSSPLPITILNMTIEVEVGG